ncbi:MAG: hypothetical protein EOO33_03100 [Comamonadaceae bacterium]|nr:MAG: hypothetical protein EOO33_03100 [Comamonadaceae bacterium]
MFYAISWGLTFMLLGLWSLACWSLHAVTVWAVASAGAFAGGAGAVDMERVPGLQGWIPPELAGLLHAMVASIGPMVQSLLETVPALAGVATVLAWAIWGLGALLLIGLAIGGHILIAFLQRRRTSPALA